MIPHDLANALVTVLGVLMIAFIIFLLTAPVIRIILKNSAKEKTVNAKVCDKFKGQRFSKYAGNGTVEEYFVVFEIEGKKKRFLVSNFSYDGYNINETGMLTYKGDRLIDFK